MKRRPYKAKRVPKPNARTEQYLLVCEVCKGGWHAKKFDAKYCGPTCRKAAQRQREAQQL